MLCTKFCKDHVEHSLDVGHFCQKKKKAANKLFSAQTDKCTNRDRGSLAPSV